MSSSRIALGALSASEQGETGRHPDGTEVGADMPRWKMTDADLADVLAFLKALPN